MEQVKLCITFNVENSAFRDIDGDLDFGAVQAQLDRTAGQVAAQIKFGEADQVNGSKIKDLNGNTISRILFEYPETLPKY